MSSDSEEIRRKIKDFYDAAAQDSDNKVNLARNCLFGNVDLEQYAQSILKAPASTEARIASAALGGRSAGTVGADAFAVPVDGGGCAREAGGKDVPSAAQSRIASAASDGRSAGDGGGCGVAGDVAQGADGSESDQPRPRCTWRATPVQKVRVRDSLVQSYASLTEAAEAEFPGLNLNTGISRIRKFVKEGTSEDGCVWRRPEEAEGTLEHRQASQAQRSSEDVGDKRTRAHKPETQRYKPTSQNSKRSTPDTSGSRNSSASKKPCRHFQSAQSDGAGGSPAGNNATATSRHEGGRINDDIHRPRTKRSSGCEKPVEKVQGTSVVKYDSRVQAGATEFPHSQHAGLQISKLIKHGQSGKTDKNGYLWRDCSAGGRADGDGASGWGNHASFQERGRSEQAMKEEIERLHQLLKEKNRGV